MSRLQFAGRNWSPIQTCALENRQEPAIMEAKVWAEVRRRLLAAAAGVGPPGVVEGVLGAGKG